MKTLVRLLLIGVVCVALLVPLSLLRWRAGAHTQAEMPRVTAIPAVKFAQSVAVRDLPSVEVDPTQQDESKVIERKEESEDEQGRERTLSALVQAAAGIDPAMQKSMPPAAALSGPTVSAPASVTRAIEPPPAPIVTISTIGRPTGQPPMRPLVVRFGSAPSIRLMSADVPPMSIWIRFRAPVNWPTYAAPTAPAAGPDRAVSTGARRTLSALVTPPLDFMSSSGAAMLCSRTRCSSRST